MNNAIRPVSLSSLAVLLWASVASAQGAGTTLNAAQAKISAKTVIGSTTLGEVLRVVGSPTVSSGTGTMNPVVFDADGDALEDSNTTVSTAGAWTWGGAGSFTSTLGVTGNTTLTGTLIGGSGALLITSPTRISTTAPAFRLHEFDAGSDEKYTELLADGDVLSLDLVDDVLSARNPLFKTQRTGIVPGDWRWGSLLGTIRPENNGGSSLGSLNRKYLTLHAWELWVQTLVAQNTIATIGGRIMVAPTTELTRDVASGDTTIYVKHNDARSNDTLLLQANGLFEKMLVTSNATDCSVSGNCTPSGSDFKYSVTRNRDGTGANDWAAGSAAVNEGNTGDGYIDMYSLRSATSEGFPGQVITDAPVVYFRMDETSPGQNFDLTGSTIAAVETGTQSNGLGVSSLMWSAVADPLWENTGGAGYLTVNDTASLRITGDLTIAFWAAWQRTTVRDEIIASRHHTGEYYVRVLSDGSVGFCHGNTSTFTCVDTAAGTMPADSVGHYYVFVRDAVSSPKRILFYKDGALHTSWTYTQAVATTTNNLLIGGDPGLGNAFDGYLDEFQIYNYQLPADRINLQYQARGNISISKFTVGPTLCGNVRTGTGAFDLAERWCLGNLAGTYGYATSSQAVYGFASGNASATWVSVDATNGFRIMNGSTEKLKADTAGDFTLSGNINMTGASAVFRTAGATAFNTGAGIYMSDNSGNPLFRVGNPAGNSIAFITSSGVLSIGAGPVTINSSTGIVLQADTSGVPLDGAAYRFEFGDALQQGLYGTSGGGDYSLHLRNQHNGSATVNILAENTAGGDSQVLLASEVGGTPSRITFSASDVFIGASQGFSGTKVAGSCTFTILDGFITNVTGC